MKAERRPRPRSERSLRSRDEPSSKRIHHSASYQSQQARVAGRLPTQESSRSNRLAQKATMRESADQMRPRLRSKLYSSLPLNLMPLSSLLLKRVQQPTWCSAQQRTGTIRQVCCLRVCSRLHPEDRRRRAPATGQPSVEILSVKATPRWCQARVFRRMTLNGAASGSGRGSELGSARRRRVGLCRVKARSRSM